MIEAYDPVTREHDIAGPDVTSFKCFVRAFYFSISTMSSTVSKRLWCMTCAAWYGMRASTLSSNFSCVYLCLESNPQKGYGDIIPRTILETCVQLAVVITGACLFASTVSADAKLTWCCLFCAYLFGAFLSLRHVHDFWLTCIWITLITDKNQFYVHTHQVGSIGGYFKVYSDEKGDKMLRNML